MTEEYEPPYVLWLLPFDDARLALMNLSAGIHTPCGDEACNPCRVRAAVEFMTEAQMKVHFPLLADLRAISIMMDEFPEKRNTWQARNINYLLTKVAGISAKWESSNDPELIPHIINYLKMIYERTTKRKEI